MLREPVFAIAYGACLSCDCTKGAVILLSLLHWDAERGSANYRSNIFSSVINCMKLFICSGFIHLL